MNDLRAVWEFMGKPPLAQIEARIQQEQDAHFKAQTEYDKLRCLENFDLAVDVYCWREEQEILAEAAALVRAEQKTVDELKGKLSGREQVRIVRKPKHTELSYETIGSSGETLETHESTDAWAYRKNPDLSDLLRKVAEGKRGALKQVEKASKEFYAQQLRLKDLQNLATQLTKCVQVGSQLLVQQGKAFLQPDVKLTRTEYRYRKQAIRRGSRTKINDDGSLILDGHRVKTFMLRK